MVISRVYTGMQFTADLWSLSCQVSTSVQEFVRARHLDDERPQEHDSRVQASAKANGR